MFPQILTRLKLEKLVLSKYIGNETYKHAVVCNCFRLTITQLVLGLLILIFHSITTGIANHVQNEERRLDRKYDFTIFCGPVGADHAGTGIWVGLLVSL